MSLSAAAAEVAGDAVAVEWVRGLFAFLVAVVTVGVPASIAYLRKGNKDSKNAADAQLAWLAHLSGNVDDVKREIAMTNIAMGQAQRDIQDVKDRLGTVERVVA